MDSHTQRQRVPQINAAPRVRRRCAFLLLCCIGFFFGSPAGLHAAPDELLTIRVGAYENPPKVYRNRDGLVVGIFPDILDMIAFEEGWRIEYVFGTWAECLQRLETNAIDLMVDIAYSEARGRVFDFSEETVFLNWGSVYAAGGKTIQSFLDLRGKTVAVVREDIHTVGENGIRRLDRSFELGLTYVYVDSYREVLELLDAGRVDAGVVNRLYGAINAKNYTITETPLIFNPVHLKFAVPKGSSRGKTLVQRIDHRVRNAKTDSTSVYNDIINAYLAGIEYQPNFRGERQAIHLTPEEAAWLANHPIVRVGVDPAYPPYSYRDPDAGYQGIAIDFMHLIGSQLGIRFDVVDGLSWPQIMNGVRDRSLDLGLSVVATPERSAHLDFSRIYLPTPLVIMAREADDDIDGPEDIDGKRVALVEGYSSAQRVIREHPAATPVMFATPLECLTAVSVGDADCTVGVLGVNDYLARREGISNLKVTARYDMRFFGQRMGTRNDWPALACIIDKALQAIPEKRKIAIFNNWLPRGAGLEGPAALQEKYALTAAETAWIDSHPMIRFGIDPEFAPFEFFEKNKVFSGIVSDYVKILNYRLGLNLKVVHGLTWPEAVARAESGGGIDLLPCVARTPQRERFLRFSEPYINFHRVIITRTEMPFIASLDDLEEHSVAVQEKSSHEGFLLQRSSIRPSPYPTLQAALGAVADGDADAFVGNIASATYWIRRLHLTNLKVAAPVSYEMQSLHFAVRRDWPELVRIIDKGLASISMTKANRIRKHWIDVEYQPGLSPGDIWKYILWVIAGGMLVVAVVLAWSYRLKQEIAKRCVIEQDLHRTQDELEQRIETRTADLARANRQLQREIDDHRRTAAHNEQLVKQLVQSQKMEAIGTMAGGIAHDFNNILMPIMGYVELAREQVPGSSKVQRYLQQVMDASHRAKDLVQQILSFSRHDDHQKRPVDLKPLVRESVKLMRSTLPATIAVDVTITSETATIAGSPTQIHQVLMNLFTNAYHAMRDTGGRLEVSLATCTIDPEDAAARDLPSGGDWLCLRVSDTGHDIPPHIRDRILEPYFTTKATDEGTGLGLSVVHGIVKKHGGHMTFDSTPGAGTTFRIVFPRIDTTADTDPKPAAGDVHGGPERIWVVDDEATIARMVKSVLDPFGYQVRVFHAGRDLLDAFTAAPDAADLVVTDMTMPEMTGARLSEELLARRPDLPIVLCTGFSETMNEQKALSIGVRAFLMKPIDRKTLAATVRRVLDDKTASA